MVDTITWNLLALRDRFREHTGLATINQLTDAKINERINDYYVNDFPSDAKIDEFNTFFTQALSATDDGVYDLSQDVDRLDDPVTINGEQILFFRDRELFFGGRESDTNNGRRFTGSSITTHNLYQSKFGNEQYITDPNLVIGTGDTTKVKHDTFSYKISDFSYSKASSEVALTGSAIPQSKYGAWSLKIDTDGTITVAAATENATGYDTPRKALDALDSSDGDTAYMGYVTVIKSDGAFTPATTALDAANVTATFTDGRFENRSIPVSALLYGQKLYVDPKSNDIAEFQALVIADRPTALQNDTDAIADGKHGPMIAANTAILYMKSLDQDVGSELLSFAEYNTTSVAADQIKRLLGQTVQRQY